MNILIYDCEIVKLIPDRNEANLSNYEYCDGWHDHSGMGISVIGYCEGLEDEPISLRCDSGSGRLSDFEAIAKSSTVVGFNSRNFDDPLCKANGINIKTDYDLLEEVRIAAGFGVHYKSVPREYRYNLNTIARANGMAKSGHGELAPMLWQDGNFQEVIDYCLHDVRITRDLLRLGLDGQLEDPNTGKMLKLRSILTEIEPVQANG